MLDNILIEQKEQETEEQFLSKPVCKSNTTAFTQLWNKHHCYLYKCCLISMNGNKTDADEAYSQVAVKVWEKLPKHASKITNPKAWLTRLTNNLCVDIHRKRNRGTKGVESIEEMALTGNEIVAPSGASPESALMRGEMEMYIRQAIDNLPPRLRDTFTLYCYEEMAYSDIAQQLALSNANVRKRIQQARQILQKQLNNYLSGLDDSPTSLPLQTSNHAGTRERFSLVGFRADVLGK